MNNKTFKKVYRFGGLALIIVSILIIFSNTIITGNVINLGGFKKNIMPFLSLALIIYGIALITMSNSLKKI